MNRERSATTVTTTAQPPSAAALSLQGVRKVYGNGLIALDGIDLQIATGDFFALLGPNGAGKSTTIGVISSLVEKSAGKVTIQGVDTDNNFSLAKRQLGVVPQEFNFNQFEKVGDIVATQAGYYGVLPHRVTKRVSGLLKALGLWEKRDQQARMLSGGMKRRLMIARALVHQPSILILDEPTAGVDVELRRTMWDFLLELNASGTTVVLTTHYLEEAEQLCRHVAILQQGKILTQGPMKTLLESAKRRTFQFDAKENKRLPEATPPAGVALTLLEPGSFLAELDETVSLNALFEWLSAEGISVQSMKNQTNRLEAIFLELTQQGVS